MIKLISFDFYNTLARFWPPLDTIQQSACRELGLNVSKAGIDEGYAVADVFFNAENARRSLSDRTEAERLDFFAEYEQILLKTAGLSVSRELAKQVWQMAIVAPKDFIAFDDTIPALAALKKKGYYLGVLSNLRRDMAHMCSNLGMAPYLDFCINSEEAGAEKPYPELFLAALERVSATPEETVHVGDQYRADVLGARGVGMHAVLIDRGGWQQDIKDCARIAGLDELGALLEDAPASLTFNSHDA
jgi:putative hydrolase of the HAD superfamily